MMTPGPEAADTPAFHGISPPKTPEARVAFLLDRVELYLSELRTLVPLSPEMTRSEANLVSAARLLAEEDLAALLGRRGRLAYEIQQGFEYLNLQRSERASEDVPLAGGPAALGGR